MDAVIGLVGVVIFVFGLFGFFVSESINFKSKIPGALICVVGVAIFLYWTG